MWWWLGAICAVVLVATYLTWIAARTRRLHVRAEAAAAALDAQLVRRAAAAAALADGCAVEGSVAAALRALAHATLEAGPDDREAAENALTRRLRDIPPATDRAAVTDVVTAGRRVGVARQVHTDLVRDALRLRRRRVVRLLRLAGGGPPPRYFEIEDTTLDPHPAGAPPA